jgi:hypothetical protein
MAVQADISTEYSMGREGVSLITDTAAYTGTYCGLIPLEPTVFTSITGYRVSGNWITKAIPSGTPVVGNFTGFQLLSGSILAYNARS